MFLKVPLENDFSSYSRLWREQSFTNKINVWSLSSLNFSPNLAYRYQASMELLKSSSFMSLGMGGTSHTSDYFTKLTEYFPLGFLWSVYHEHSKCLNVWFVM